MQKTQSSAVKWNSIKSDFGDNKNSKWYQALPQSCRTCGKVCHLKEQGLTDLCPSVSSLVARLSNVDSFISKNWGAFSCQ